MRRILSVAGALAIAVTVAGCNRSPLRAPQQVACNCPGVAEGNGEQMQRLAPPPVAHHRSAHRSRYHRRSYDEGSSHEWSSSYSDVEASSYSYRSRSRVYDIGENDDYGGDAQAHAYARAYAGASSTAGTSAYADSDNDGAYTGDAAHYETDDRWQDGYGRYHNRAHLGAKALRKRLDPWHGYNHDWDNDR